MSFRKYGLGSYEEMRAAHSLGGARALQHRARRLRQARARQARDGLGGLAAATSGGSPSASSRTCRAGSPTCSGRTASSAATASPRCCPRCPRRQRSSSAPTARRILLSMSVLYGDEGIQHRLRDSGAKALVTDTANRAPHPRGHGRAAVRARAMGEAADVDWTPSSRRLDRATTRRTRPPTTRPALLLVGHHRPGEGHPARPPLPAGARGVRVLPRRPGRRALPRHGRVGLGGGHLPAARSRGATGRSRWSTRARAASTPRSSCASYRSTGSRTCSRRPPRCGR